MLGINISCINTEFLVPQPDSYTETYNTALCLLYYSVNTRRRFNVISTSSDVESTLNQQYGLPR